MTKEEINELLFNVYNARVDADSGEGSAARMIEKDNDGGKKQRGRAEFYRPVVLETLKQLGLYERPKPVGRIEKLEAALKNISEGDIPRKVKIPFRDDGQSSKHDRCEHGQWFYEDCGCCIEDYARKALEGKDD